MCVASRGSLASTHRDAVYVSALVAMAGTPSRQSVTDRAELSTHIHRETGPQRPTHSLWSFLFEKTKLECGKKPPAFRQRQAHNAVRHAARSRPARSAPGHKARTRASSRKEGVIACWRRTVIALEMGLFLTVSRVSRRQPRQLVSRDMICVLEDN